MGRHVVEELPTPIRGRTFAGGDGNKIPKERALLVQQSFWRQPSVSRFTDLLAEDESRHIDDLVEISGLSSSEVLAALFDLELKGVVRQLPGKQFLKVLL